MIAGRHSLTPEQINSILLELVGKAQNRLLRENDRPDKAKSTLLDQLEKRLVAFQRSFSPHDNAVSLRPPSRMPTGGEIRIIIKKEDKNPVTFLTGGNDSGVCDSTMDKQGLRRPQLALKYNYQEHGIFRQTGDRAPRRFGQIRTYAAKDAGGRPVLIVNSIDLEAEERQNPHMYQLALDYVAEFAVASNFSRVLVGRHPDMALVPFESDPTFRELFGMGQTSEHIQLIDHFDEKMGFQDIFGGERNYAQKEGKADFYELFLKPYREAHVRHNSAPPNEG
jgi:hypothetical protein